MIVGDERGKPRRVREDLEQRGVVERGRALAGCEQGLKVRAITVRVAEPGVGEPDSAAGRTAARKWRAASSIRTSPLRGSSERRSPS